MTSFLLCLNDTMQETLPYVIYTHLLSYLPLT